MCDSDSLPLGRGVAALFQATGFAGLAGQTKKALLESAFLFELRMMDENLDQHQKHHFIEPTPSLLGVADIGIGTEVDGFMARRTAFPASNAPRISVF
ncbi:MAG: hypothetical protein DRP64_19555 [Verrucomicrobia bacterium]|nr:MAG: hypothetical protein DRP64_19555 [Verrucomicrobiota bacterium]